MTALSLATLGDEAALALTLRPKTANPDAHTREAPSRNTPKLQTLNPKQPQTANPQLQTLTSKPSFSAADPTSAVQRGQAVAALCFIP
eukprot:1154325-Rhodomonas_salina.1